MEPSLRLVLVVGINLLDQQIRLVITEEYEKELTRFKNGGPMPAFESTSYVTMALHCDPILSRPLTTRSLENQLRELQ